MGLHIVGVAAEGNHLFFVTTTFQKGTGAIQSCDVSKNRNDPKKLLTGLGKPGQIVARGSTIVWTDDNGPSGSGIYIGVTHPPRNVEEYRAVTLRWPHPRT
ncbi:MAG: hypothetical protein NZX77_22495, partial [Polyangiaceae bacterium]|nr:hypothetical protein [Polyangiaceae bacterium]